MLSYVSSIVVISITFSEQKLTVYFTVGICTILMTWDISENTFHFNYLIQRCIDIFRLYVRHIPLLFYTRSLHILSK